VVFFFCVVREHIAASYLILECTFLSFTVQLLQEEKELKDVKTAVNGLVEVFKVRIAVLIFSLILFLNLHLEAFVKFMKSFKIYSRPLADITKITIRCSFFFPSIGRQPTA